MKPKIWDWLTKRKEPEGENGRSYLSLSFEETYYYDITLANISDNQHAEKPPEGIIRIKTPYYIWRDEGRYEESLKREVNLENHHKTNLDSIHEIWDADKKFTLENILAQAKEEFTDQQDTTIYNLPRITRFNYQPDKLPITPVSIDIKLFDEVEMSETRELFRLITNLEKGNSETLSEIVNNISDQGGFENSLLFNFSITLKLPEEYSVSEDQLLIKSIALEWPLATSPRHVGVTLIKSNEINYQHEYESKYVFYDPENREIRWSDILLYKAKAENDSLGQIEYKSHTMQLSLREPGEFYDQQVLSGTIIVSIPALLSGLEIDAAPPMNVHKSSNLDINLSIYIDELFKTRQFAPYQNLHFPNLILNEMRLADILHMLKDMRFQNVSWYTIAPPQKKRNYLLKDTSSPQIENSKKLVTANRLEGSGNLQLLILLEGLKTTTTREKAILGDEKFTTGFPAGSTNVYIRGLLEGDSDRIVQVISEIHERLKERFRHVSALK